MSEVKARIIRLPIKDLSREEWLAMRKRGIGGSDASTVVGLNPWSSRLYLYADKLGLIPDREDNEAMRQGRDLEDYVAKRWEEATGKKVRRENFMLFNDDYPWAFANVDRMVVGEKSILEIKTTSVYNNSDFENGEIPPNYYVQVQHYLAVTGYEKAYLAVLVMNKGFYHFAIKRNQAEIDALMAAEKDFWDSHVKAGIPPDADGSDSAAEVLKNMARMEDTALLMDAEDLFYRLDAVKEDIKRLDKEKNVINQTIIQRMGNKTRGQAMGWTCSYLPQSRETVDGKKLKAISPEIYAQCVKTTISPVFRVTKRKEDK